MKSSLNFSAIIFCLLFVPGRTNAQAHAGIFIHALYAAPVGTISNDLYSNGGGAEGGILAGRKATRFAGTIGYSHFFKTGDNVYGDKTYIPIKAGIRQYLPLNFIFLQADAGIGLVNYAHTADSESPFAYDFLAGVKFSGFEALIGWDTFHSKLQEGWSSWFTIKAGINFGF